MKKLMMLLLLIPSFSYSADLNSFNNKPKVLELYKYRTASGNLDLRYINDNSHLNIRISTNTKEVNDFLLKVMKSDVRSLNCDGDFMQTFDRFGNNFIQVNSIKSCLSDDGSVVAHSIGLNKLSDKEVAASKKFIEDSLKNVAVVTNVNVNNGHNVKEVINPKAGVFSPLLDVKTADK